LEPYLSLPTFSPTFDYAQALDQADALAGFRAEFVVSDPGLIYLDGNSLGRLPRRTVAIMQQLVEQQWGDALIRGWGQGWYAAPQRIGEKIARLLGAAPGQVIACDSTSTNLYKLVMAALALRPGRKKIISDTLNFPSDLYILQGCIHTLNQGHHLELVEASAGLGVDSATLCAAIDADTALVTLSHVVFKSGYLYDAAEITRRAHAAGALVLWDLSHAAGAVPLALDDWDVDFAVGCTYKYLNGGPGAPAFLYVRRELQDQALSPVWGWFGQRAPFAFDLDYQPSAGVSRFLSGTPALLSLLAVEPGVDLLLEAGMDNLRAKSLRQTGYLIDLFDHSLAPLGFTLGSPRSGAQRGAHVSVRHPEGYRINCALINEMAVLPDFREPDNLRLGIAPLYTTYAEIWEAVQRIARVVSEQRYRNYPTQRAAVT
jgi:kynureninase